MDERYPIDWIDDYIANLRGYVVVRKRDNLLIKIPNEAYKLNASAVGILDRILNGGSVHDICRENGNSEAVRRDLYEFMTGMKRLLQGRLDEANLPPGIIARPFALGFNELPVLSEISLTDRCNVACLFCYAGCGSTQKHSSRVMTTDEVKRVLTIIRRDAEVPSVSFTGGEPLLRRDLEELVLFARRELQFRVNLITNGTLMDEGRAESLSKAGLHSAQVSLGSPDQDLHDRIVRVRGSYRKTLAGIKALQKYSVRVHTNTTLNRINRLSVLTLPGFVKELGLERFSMNLIIPCGNSLEGSDDINLRYNDVAETILSIQSESKRQGVDFIWYSPIPSCIFNTVANRLGNKGCAACDGLLSVSPEGDILPCSSWAEPIGNLLKHGFAELWDGRKAASIRSKAFAPEQCRSCPDIAMCQGACPLYWRHFGYQELQNCRVQNAIACS